MNTKKNRRRGVVLSLTGQRKLEVARRQLEKTVNHGDRFTLEELSDRTQLALSTITRVLETQSGVDKQTLDQFFASFDLLLERSDYQHPDRQETAQDSPTRGLTPEPTSCSIDWGEAIDVSDFYGRTTELATLEQWIEQNRCRLIAILGMGGIGKTALSVKLAQQLQEQFEFVIWRSLRNAPPLDLLLADLIQVLSGQREVVTAPAIATLLSRLMHYLRQHRCLLILDNGETILQGGQFAGTYRQGYETYGELLQQVGEMPHQSCVALTSREKPEAIASLEGENLPVRSFALPGLPLAASNSLFDATGLSTSPTGRHKLLETYSGNPLALKIVSTSIRELFGGDVDAFLAEETAIFNGIRRLLDRQFQRLTELEKQVMYWLAIDREWVAIAQLQTDIVPPVPKQRLMETLESLARRSLIEHSKARFTQQPVVMEYMTEQLIEQMCQEIQQQTPQLFLTHAPIEATAKDYVRSSQIRVILAPLGDRLRNLFDTQEALTAQLQQLLHELHNLPSHKSGYGAGNLLNLLSHLNIDLAGYDFSHLTIRQAWLQDVSLHRVNLSHSHLVGCQFAQSLSHPLSMAVSPDGDLVAIGVENGSVHVWQISTGQPLLNLPAHDAYIFALTFSPDGKNLLSGGMEGSIKAWNLTTGNCWQTWKVAGAVWSLAFSPDGQLLAIGTGDVDRSIHLWDWQTQQPLKTLIGHLGQVSALAFVPPPVPTLPQNAKNRCDLWWLIGGGHDGILKIWDLDRGECVQTLIDHKGPILSVKLHPQGDRFASSSFDRSIKLWDLATGECLQTFLGHTAEVTSASFSPDGEMLASSSYDRTIRLWDVSTGRCLQVLQGHLDHVWAVAFIGDRLEERGSREQTLVSTSWDQSVRFWQVSRTSSALAIDLGKGRKSPESQETIVSQCIKTIQGSYIGIRCIAFHPQRYLLASGGLGCGIRLWNESGRCIKVLQGQTAGIQKIAFHPQGQLIASGAFTGEIKIWDVETERCLLTIEQYNSSWIHVLEFSPQGYLVSSSSSDATLRFWDIQTGECFRSIVLEPDAYVLGLAFHPQGCYLVSAGNDDRLRWWDIETGECLRTVQANHEGHAWCVVFHPQGHLFATIGSDCAVKLWDAESGECLSILQGSQGVNGAIAFSPDGTILASGRGDRIIRLWDVATGESMNVLEGHTSAIASIVFRPVNPSEPSRQILASGSYDQTIRLWDVRSGECLSILRPDRIYEGMDITDVTGLTKGAIATLKSLGAVEH